MNFYALKENVFKWLWLSSPTVAVSQWKGQELVVIQSTGLDVSAGLNMETTNSVH